MVRVIRASEIIQSVRAGECDLRLDELVEAISARRALIAAAVVVELTVGSRVMTDNSTRPHHRRLKLATVLEVKPRSGKVLIQFDDEPHKRWTWPAEYLTVVEAEVRS